MSGSQYQKGVYVGGDVFYCVLLVFGCVVQVFVWWYYQCGKMGFQDVYCFVGVVYVEGCLGEYYQLFGVGYLYCVWVVQFWFGFVEYFYQNGVFWCFVLCFDDFLMFGVVVDEQDGVVFVGVFFGFGVDFGYQWVGCVNG